MLKLKDQINKDKQSMEDRIKQYSTQIDDYKSQIVATQVEIRTLKLEQEFEELASMKRTAEIEKRQKQVASELQSEVNSLA